MRLVASTLKVKVAWVTFLFRWEELTFNLPFYFIGKFAFATKYTIKVKVNLSQP